MDRVYGPSYAPQLNSSKKFPDSEIEFSLANPSNISNRRSKIRTSLTIALALVCTLTFFLHRGNVGDGTILKTTINSGLSQDELQFSPCIPDQSPAVQAEHGAVSAQNVRCSNIGVQIMQDGGNAVDAAVAAAFCIGVVNMFSAGVGGGGFMTVRLPPTTPDGTSEVWNVDFREMAPAAAYEEMYIDDPLAAQFGGLAVGVPGELHGLWEAHQRWGQSEWAALIQPSIDLANGIGWTVDPELASWINDPDYEDLMLNNPTWSAIFAPNGTILQEGDPIQRVNYATTLTTIATQGIDAFYEGPIADAIIDIITENNGVLTHDDLLSYQVRVTHALKGTFYDNKVYTTHAPASGPALLLMLNILEHFDLGSSRTGLNEHRVIEAMKFGFAARTNISDILTASDLARIAPLSTKAHGDVIAANLTDNTTHPPEYYNPVFDIQSNNGTSHISAVDKNRMAVALTHTINLVFGSQLMEPTTGVILNDEMDDFSIPGIPNAFGLMPSPYNYPTPGKRPVSTTVPTIFEHPDGSFYIAVGGVGGSYILGAVFQVILNIDRWGMDVADAIKVGRSQDQLYPLYTFLEETIPPEFVLALAYRGHNISIYDPCTGPLSDVEAIVQSGSGITTLFAAADWRTNSGAAGY
ncbi:nucleophile aminohydrolase [Hygrophoropsis aurantiaca]|uniref:Nucleophile aminohydrolase n=1 Tax=Hygrophoropsis aurantiaca TaxID=72124 RepID=A0ACB8A1G4_9AGAM|nr:nucleophile aminohydrolase [Hygrophoropsis aurantiaca]